MEIIREGQKPAEDIKLVETNFCTEEPGDPKCWLQLD